ncbi:dipeptide transport ATP-binding protein DppF [Salmonella enterica subsp. enterica]|uniref:Dipeptide transport ATP-binding protein DppF n=1 Tax=Salmonella enterica I TaxID=59201 RepID=A0A379UZ99_SALET|nr:dipeptide transport ATP-binding protein DppF [Salmonella enterica subsp. enterica]
MPTNGLRARRVGARPGAEPDDGFATGYGLSYVFISHDLSVVEHIADEVMVMYLGRCVEKGTKEQIFNNPRHPYTQALLSATPRLNPDDRRERIKLTGELPSPLNPPPGCAFNARCSRRFGPCTQLQPQLKEYDGQLVACFAVDQDETRRSR